MKTLFGGTSVASDIVKNINSLDYNRVQTYNQDLTDEQIKELIVYNFKAITGLSVSSYRDVEDYLDDDAIYAYYEYYQFKKGLFECTSITYDSNYGRVETITFKFTGKIQ